MSQFCYLCGGQFRIAWGASVKKLRPLNISDNKPHSATCRGRRVAASKTSTPNKVGAAKGESRPKPKEIAGSLYRPACGKNCIPWESCSCSFSTDDLAATPVAIGHVVRQIARENGRPCHCNVPPWQDCPHTKEKLDELLERIGQA